jgi:hypothetical protein
VCCQLWLLGVVAPLPCSACLPVSESAPCHSEPCKGRRVTVPFCSILVILLNAKWHFLLLSPGDMRPPSSHTSGLHSNQLLRLLAGCQYARHAAAAVWPPHHTSCTLELPGKASARKVSNEQPYTRQVSKRCKMAHAAAHLLPQPFLHRSHPAIRGDVHL